MALFSQLFSQIEALRIYALCACGVALNLFFLATYTGVVRLRSRHVVNPEDAKTVTVMSAVGDVEHATVLRIHRAHRNAIENAVPFFAIGLLYALSGASARGAWAYFGTYVAARWLHTICYLNGLQPWRTILYTVGLLATLGMMVHLVIVAF